MPPVTPIDPRTGGRLALAGRIVTMDAAFTVLPHGAVYIDQGGIVAVQDASAPPPAGMEDVPAIATGGTVYPGLIELHNHLSYNALQLWDVPRRFTNRGQWGGTDEYRRLISGPMQVVGRTPGLLPAVIRYVECKCLLGGVTTSQGVELFSNQGARRFYRGIVRNVEQTDDPALPEAATRIADVEATDATRFLARLAKSSCLLLHLSEGIDQAAREHFLSLHLADGQWAISPALAGIHCAALERQDFDVLAAHGGAIVWSPLSNLLLYGQTALIQEARAAGVRIGLGSDWSPSGSKNLLGELKAARLAGDGLGDREIVAMVTRDAAAILTWERVAGTLEPGHCADLLVIDGVRSDPYAALIAARETAIRLVMINGVARYGQPALMARLGAAGETIRVGGRPRALNLAGTVDPVVGALMLAEARRQIADALAQLPHLAEALEQAPGVRAVAAEGLPSWFLALDELSETGMELRPRLALAGTDVPTGPSLALTRAAVPLSRLLKPLTLDPLTVADDADFLPRIRAQQNLPQPVKDGLAAML